MLGLRTQAGLRVECERASKALRDRDDRLREMQETAIGIIT